MLHYFWPNLLKNGFLHQFVTPLIKAIPSNAKKGKAKKNKATEEMHFYSFDDYKKWQILQDSMDTEITKSKRQKWRIKYYKGLGTSTADEGREYFSNLDKNLKVFQWKDSGDDGQIDMAFKKTRASDRKDWISESHKIINSEEMKQNNDDCPDGKDSSHSEVVAPGVTYSDFIDNELRLFSYADVMRSIPSAIDGLKPSQRKVLFGC